MQPAPSEYSQNATSLNQPRAQSPSSQHGFQDAADPASGSLTLEDTATEPVSSYDEVDTSSVSSAGTNRGRRPNTRRKSGRGTSSQEGSPGSRIEEYEKAHGAGRKPSDGMIFQIVPSAAGRTRDGASLQEFPTEVLTHILSHLAPETLSSMSLVSRRFHRLVTTPHAWRIAFSRYFRGSDSTETASGLVVDHASSDVQKSERRSFTRLSALATWRSEYILRTRLLRSLGRGRPALHAVARSGTSKHSGGTSAAAVITYSSGLLYPVSHIHATFGVGLNKKQPLFIHGAVEQGAVSSSDPSTSKIGNWGLADFEAFKHFADLYVGDAEYGLGPGDVVGMPNVMDVSQPYGKLYGEACPGGRLFYTSTTEQRGRFLSMTSSAQHELGIPEVTMIGCSVCSIWIAKSEPVLKNTNGIFGCLAGFSNGVLCAFALGMNPVQGRRFEKGEPSAKWVLCPGVPIIAISVDEQLSGRRSSSNRVWAVVLNALGEVFYLNQIPIRPEFNGKASAHDIDRLAWQTGRSVEWTLVECTRRAAKPDPFDIATVDGSYSPRSSCDTSGLSRGQLVGETKEIEKFLLYKPKHFRGVCDGWDMRRQLAVDFAGDDRHGAGEAIFIISCGLEEGGSAAIRRLVRRKNKMHVDFDLDAYPAIQRSLPKHSVFGRGTASHHDLGSSPSPRSMPRSRTSSTEDITETSYTTEWHLSNFVFGDHRNVQISAVALDQSEFATLAANEDPLLGMSSGSSTSSPIASPVGHAKSSVSTAEIPGQRARFMAIGTSIGVVMLWDMRASPSLASDVVNSVQPLRVIYTKSPQISCLALTPLYLVHGGNDGLVQAWDPLASTSEPIRTLNSRFSDRARRRIAQAEASVHGVGNNYYAAGAIVLDPDPTILRGMVTLGTHLRYWSYSSTAADAYKSRKRGQLRRRSERGSNSVPSEQKYHHTGRGLLKGYIANEKHELEREKIAKRQEHERLSGRFGTTLLGEDASEEDLLAYATMLSAEAYTSDEARRRGSDEVSSSAGGAAAAAVHGPDSVDVDADVEEAIRMSLLDSAALEESLHSTDFTIPIRYARSSKHGTFTRHADVSTGTGSTGPASATEQSDLDFALQLSLAEHASRGGDADAFPALASKPGSDGSGHGKGKGKGKGRS